MKHNIYFYLLLTSGLLLGCSFLWAQENQFSQQNAEKLATEKYEASHPPRDSMPMAAPARNEALFGAHLTRTAALLENSSKDRRNTVHILIYGQSIVGSAVFTEQVGLYLKEKFPYADIVLENRAIGGFTADLLVRTAVHDLYPAYPDLIIFHVYGGERTGELEQIFSNVRRTTTSEILLMNHHLNATQTKPDETAAKYIRYIAQKYDCELADISAEWPEYLAANNLKPTDLLRDGVHPNRNGNWLLTQLVCRHIRFNNVFPSSWYRNVRGYYAVTAFDKGEPNAITLAGNSWKLNNATAVCDVKGNSMRFSFTGNRVDLISGHPLKLAAPGSAKLLLDGKPVDAANTVYTITRPSAGPGTWWPAIRQIGHQKPLVEENWTFHIESINADTTVFTYRVKGSVTGDDGTGNSNEVFVSRSGRVVIQPDDIMFTRIKKIFKVAIPNGFDVTWSVVPLFKGIYQAPVDTDRTKTYQTTLLQGIANGPHTLELIANGDGPVSVESFEVYEPGPK